MSNPPLQIHWAGVVAMWTLMICPYYLRQGEVGGWVALGFGIYMMLQYGACRIAYTMIRAAVRAHHLRAGTLAELVDDTFIHYLEFMVVIAYGFLSSVSCLVGVDSDPTDLLAADMWGECGPVTLVRRSLPPRRPQPTQTCRLQRS